MKKIRATGDKKEDVLGDKIKNLRAYRDRFRVDPPFDAFQQEMQFHSRIDPVHRIQVGLGDPDKFYPGLFSADPAKTRATDGPSERIREITEILLFRLEYDDFDLDRLQDLSEGYRNKTWSLSEEENTRLRKSHQRGANLMFEDGYTPRERRIIQLVDPGFNFKAGPRFSHETIAVNKSLNPAQRRQKHVNLMELVEANPPETKRPRSQVKKDIQGVMRGRKHWRIKHIFKACEVMDELVVYLASASTDQRTLNDLERRYRRADLYASNSGRISSSYHAQLAAAIASAEHLANGTDDYAPNDKLATNVMRHYWLFEKSKRTAAKTSPHSKRSVFKAFLHLYSGAI